MKAKQEKRACERQHSTAPILYSYFNKERFFDAQALNHCANGMYIKSNFFLQPGTAVYIRTKIPPNSRFCSGSHQGLRSVTLAEVKWCKQVNEVNDSYYGVGVKYYEPEY